MRTVCLLAGEKYKDGGRREHSIIIIIFRECFSLWYLCEDGKLNYDGWEIGDYRESWLDETIYGG